MAATDKPYRSQRTLDIVFGVSCGLMLVTTLWMFAQDYGRDFKAVQRKFRDVEAAVAERDMVDRLPAPGEVAQKRDAAKAARDALEAKKKELKPRERELLAQRELTDEAYRGVKADYDAFVSYRNIARDEVGKYPADSSQGKAALTDADRWDKKVLETETKLQKAKADFDQADLTYRQEIRDKLEPLEKQVADAEDSIKKLTGTFDRYAKLATQKAWGTGDTFRALPIIDGFASPTKINQLWLPDLTIDYGGFKDVPRYDRCTTCHLGIDRASYDKATLAKLGDTKESERLNGKLREAQKMLVRRHDAGENLGFNPNDLPGERSGSMALVTLLLLASSLVGAVSLGVLEKSWRLGVRVMTAGLALTLITSGVMAITMPRVPQVKTVELSEGQVNQFCAHPRMDLFVGSNSPHPMEKFGCTTCHAGQGSATEFNLASHTPNDATEEKQWRKAHNWESNHYWDFPMLPKRFVESSCLKCHHQVTDLVREGVKQEAPKLLNGYNLVKDMGCFGCHEIQGIKNGRWVGPDLRLEPTPALDLLSAADQDKAKSDPTSPPGQLRKVGPSLRRLAEKSPEPWTRKWILNPRGFREDTRMPHFYNLSTNSPDALPADQKSHPATEVHSIAHYLFHESRGHLSGQDSYRTALLSGPRNMRELQKELASKGLSDRDMKDLFEVSRRFADVALLSSPRDHKAINGLATRQRQMQEKLRELHKSKAEAAAQGGNTAVTESAIATTAEELSQTTDRLVQLGKPTPIKDRIIDGNGDPVKLPAKEGNAERGRELFTERGCLACHSHQGTTSPGGVAAVHSDANFGPELSRIADKIIGGQDGPSGRAWLVQWLLNPNVYHPRTRMPITHLTVDQANDVATWLLSQKAPAWSVEDPKAPTRDELKALARVYLARVGWVRDDEQDAFLETGIPKDRLTGLPRDADERLLVAGKPLTNDHLKLYIGKKAIARQGCYACHDIPGFETAKPIGTGLNDWGKKENERLAFEDGASFVKNHFAIVQKRGASTADLEAAEAKMKSMTEIRDEIAKRPADERSDEDIRTLARLTREIESLQPKLDKLRADKEVQARIAELREKQLTTGLSSKEEKELKDLASRQFFEPSGGKRPFEEAFYHSLEHHQREGFLHLKLLAPRSYDYGRRVKWDDRLRMPQFQFARTRQQPGESDAAYAARKEKAEAEAREAVMTFVLGLVAEPVPFKYVNQPKGDRAAEVAGRQVLEKYNCASCHQIAPGQFELPTSPDLIRSLVDAHDRVMRNREDYAFLNHNAWFGAPQLTPGKLTAVGFSYAEENRAMAEERPGFDVIRLSDALRFAGPDGVIRDLPAGTSLLAATGSYSAHQPYGGTWANLMMPYVNKKKNYTIKEPGKSRSHLPPTLIREGERVRPDWLYGFLLNPSVIRPYDDDPAKSYMLLRMPKFNLSPEEAEALVKYFAAAARTSNPGAGVTTPFVEVPQKDSEYWRNRTSEYAKYAAELPAALKRDEEKLKKEIEALKKQVADPRTPGPIKARLQEQLSEREKGLAEELPKRLKEVQAALAAPRDKKVEARYDDLYSRRAIQMLADPNGCYQCHSIGSRIKEGAQGPNLALAADRIRPEWAEKWIHAPRRLFPYEPVMNALFQAKHGSYGWTFQNILPGDPLTQTTAVRDLIMDGPRLAELIKTVPAPAPVPGDKDKDKEKGKDKAKDKDKPPAGKDKTK